MTEQSNEKFLCHAPCNNCGSRDNLAIYENHTYCFGCRIYLKTDGQTLDLKTINKKEKEHKMITGKIEALPKRKITSETCKVFNYETGIYNGKHCHISNYFDKQYNRVAQHIRFPDKSFIWIGDTDKITLFGQNLWRDGGRMVVVTEGELDAMSVSQCQNNKFPVVSVPSGAASAKKYILRELEWLSKFEKIVLFYDNDPAGNSASIECANILPVKKVRIVKAQGKDANDLLQAGKSNKIIDAIWEAKTFSPAGIVEGSETKELLLKDEHFETYPYCWNGLNKKLSGIRLGEINLLTGGTGTGKSQVCREIAFHLISQKIKIGYIALEESVKRSLQGLVSIPLNKLIHIPEVKKKTSEEEIIKAWEEVKDNVCFFDHFGSSNSDDLMNKIRYMVKALDCKIIFLDHISIVISALEDGDERRLIDNTMTSLRRLVEELKCGVFIVSHLKRPEGKVSHEQGLQVSLAHLRGSHSLATIPNQIISFERDQQSETENNILTCRVLKNRFSGDTGVASTLIYNKDTGRLTEGDFDG